MRGGQARVLRGREGPVEVGPVGVRVGLVRQGLGSIGRGGGREGGGLGEQGVFRVIGDGKTLWNSPPTQNGMSSFKVDVDVSEIDVLKLQIDRVANERSATTIWLDPLLKSKHKR